MKNRIVIDLSVFTLILKELKSIRKELRSAKGLKDKEAIEKRELSDPIYTPEVLKILKITPTTLINYEKRGLIKYHKEGRSKVYSEAEIQAFKKGRGKRRRVTLSLLDKLPFSEA